MSERKRPGDEEGSTARGISRRRLLAGGVVAAPTLALLHETVPHQGIHDALGGAQHPAAEAARAAPRAPTAATACPAIPTASAPPARPFAAGRWSTTRRTASTRPTILRDFDYGRTTPAAERADAARVGRSSRATRRSRSPRACASRPGPTTAGSRARRCAAREGDLLRIRFGNGSEHPHTMHFHGIHPADMDGVPGLGAGVDRARRVRPPTSSTPSPSGSTSTTATSRRSPSTSPAGCTARSSSTRRRGGPTPTRW